MLKTLRFKDRLWTALWKVSLQRNTEGVNSGLATGRRAANLSGYRTENSDETDSSGYSLLFFVVLREAHNLIAIKIITNNPNLKERPGAEYYEEPLLHILNRVRDLIHQHYRLLTHPLAGSVKPNETPYKSVVLYPQPGTEVDAQSLQIIEAALQLTKTLLRDRPTPLWNDRVREDFALIDQSLIESGLENLKHL